VHRQPPTPNPDHPTSTSQPPTPPQAANVLISSCPTSPYGFVSKVSDFGLSRCLNPGATHQSTKTFGTITHQSPEMLRLGKLSSAADVYSFGILVGGVGVGWGWVGVGWLGFGR